MKTARFSGLLSFSLAMFALSAAAQTPDGTTPANEGMCDVLTDATPGLYGLCVAMCEAQDCEATLDPFTGIVTFDPSCNPSSERILANYDKLAGPSDPRMPCVELPCPCWTEAEIDNIGGFQFGDVPYDRCFSGQSSAGLIGFGTDGRGAELAYLIEINTGPVCISMEENPPTNRELPVNADEYRKCKESIIDECNARGVPIEVIQ